MKQKIILLLMLAGFSFGEMDIPEAGRIRVDGDLSDWQNTSWTPINKVITGAPTNIANAVWSLYWDEDGMIYVAVQYDDADVVLRNGNRMFDCIELYARGDTGSKPLDYYKTQTSAQSYLLGLRNDQTNHWLQMGPFRDLPPHNPIQSAVTLKGSRFIYEAAVTLYDSFDPKDARRASESELFAEEEIGFDVAIIDIGTNGPAGILGYNSRKKRSSADQIAEHIVED